MKRFAIGSLLLTLVGCASIDNPYQFYSPQEMHAISTQSLCNVARNGFYKPSINVANEMQRRQLQDCSGGEVYCRTLGLNYGSKEYASCRLRYQKIELEKQMARSAERRDDERLNLEREALRRQAAQPNYNTVTSGYTTVNHY